MQKEAVSKGIFRVSLKGVLKRFRIGKTRRSAAIRHTKDMRIVGGRRVCRFSRVCGGGSLFLFDLAAGDPSPGISRGLGVKIIGVLVDHDGTAEDIGNAKPACQHRLISFAAIGEQRRQIAGVIRMFHALGIEMAVGFREIRAGAVRALVDMEAEKTGVFWQAVNMGHHPDTFGFLIETDFAPKIRKITSSPNQSDGVGTMGTNCHKNHLRYSI